MKTLSKMQLFVVIWFVLLIALLDYLLELGEIENLIKFGIGLLCLIIVAILQMVKMVQELSDIEDELMSGERFWDYVEKYSHEHHKDDKNG